MRNRVFVLAFACVIGAVLAGYGYIVVTKRSFSRIQFGLGAIQPAGAPAYVENAMPTPALKSWANGEPQAKIKDFARNEFLAFDRVLLGYSRATTRANGGFYWAFMPREPLIPIGVDSGNVFRLRGTDNLVEVLLGDQKTLDRVPDEIAAANALAEKYPDVHFNYYGVSEWTMTKTALDAGYRDPVAQAWDEFTAGVSVKAQTAVFNADDWTRLFFKTDHHWNPTGAHKAYQDIVQLLSRSNPAVMRTTIVPFEQRVVTGTEFRGSIARTAALYDISEPFLALTGHDPALEAFVDGKRNYGAIVNSQFLKDPPKAPFASLYGMFNGGDYPLIEYRKDAPGAGNLLIFGDSFSNSMEDLVASHFHRTYVIDLRHYAKATGKPFDMDSFVHEHGISDVLFMGRPSRVMTVPVAIRDGVPVK